MGSLLQFFPQFFPWALPSVPPKGKIYSPGHSSPPSQKYARVRIVLSRLHLKLCTTKNLHSSCEFCSARTGFSPSQKPRQNSQSALDCLANGIRHQRHELYHRVQVLNCFLCSAGSGNPTKTRPVRSEKKKVFSRKKRPGESTQGAVFEVTGDRPPTSSTATNGRGQVLAG